MMNQLRNSVLASILMVGALSGSAWAGASSGGVSDGGGGTTNPSPAHPQLIHNVVSQYAGTVLLVSLNAEEANFNRMSAVEQANSPFYKLFRSEKNIFDWVRSTSIELR